MRTAVNQVIRTKFRGEKGFPYRNRRSYRLRLIPNGVRITQRGRTMNLIEPRIVWPGLLLNRGFLLESGGQIAWIELHWFDRRNGALIIEHCSQFLSVDQQAKYGSQLRAMQSRYLKPPKPFGFLDLSRSICLATAACILLTPALFHYLKIDLPAGGSPWDVPEIRQIYNVALAALVCWAVVLCGAVCAASQLEKWNLQGTDQLDK